MSSVRDDRPEDAPPPVSALRVARLETLRRLAMGGAHSLNNAFTTLLGEVGFLRDACKDDPEVADACETMQGELERCVRITRALLARRSAAAATDAAVSGPGGGGEVDLVRMLGELGALLRETLGSQHTLRLTLPDDLLPVTGPSGALETALLVLVHYAADTAEGASTLELRAERAADAPDGAAQLRLDVRAAGARPGVEEVLLAPRRAEDPVTAAALGALSGVVGALGGSLAAERTAPDAWAARLRLPLVP